MIDLPLNILVIDDDDVTAEAVRRCLAKQDLGCRVTAAEDGLEALAMLRGETAPQVDRPFIILLDLNMPRMNGFEFLEQLRQDPNFGRCIVFVLSTSSADYDRARAYSQCIAGYMVKSEIGHSFAKLAALLKGYVHAVRLPD